MGTYGVNWWATLIRGIVFIIFGLAALVWPGITLFVLIVLFGAFALVEGIATIVQALRRTERGGGFWARIAGGVIGILVGLGVFFYPGITALLLVYIIAGWAIATGVLDIIAGISLRDKIKGEWWLVAAGVVSLLFGFLIAINPGAGALALVVIIGIYALIAGILLLVLGVQSREQPPTPA